jgi:tryptophan-rich sensory protein
MAALIIFVALVAVAAFGGARFHPDDWYAALSKPDWTPPSWLFAPVWTLLYAGIAVAGWLVWRRSGGRLTPALVLWLLQLGLNATWSWLFFGLHRPGMALVDIAALLLCILAFTIVARRLSPVSSLLFVPYALWVAFATALNYAIWQRNS